MVDDDPELKTPLVPNIPPPESKRPEQIQDDSPSSDAPTDELSLSAIINDIPRGVGQLARAELDLLRAELRADIQAEVKMAAGLGLSVVLGLLALNALVLAAILALATTMRPWLAALLAAAVLLASAGVAALLGWNSRVRYPLQLTRQTLKDDVQWAKERLA